MTEQKNRENRGGFRNMTAGILLGLAIGAVLGILEGDLLSGLGFGFVIGIALGVAFERRGNFMQYPPYIVRRMLVSVSLFVIAFLASQRLLGEPLSRPLEIAVALAGAIPTSPTGTAACTSSTSRPRLPPARSACTTPRMP